MPRTARVAPGGIVFHVLNRGLARRQVFEKAGDYQAFQRVLKETRETLYAHWEEAVELNW